MSAAWIDLRKLAISNPLPVTYSYSIAPGEHDTVAIGISLLMHIRAKNHGIDSIRANCDALHEIVLDSAEVESE